MAVVYSKSKDGKLVETEAQAPLVKSYSLEELNSALAASKARRDVKVIELAGAEAEVKAFEGKIVEAGKLGVVEVVSE